MPAITYLFDADPKILHTTVSVSLLLVLSHLISPTWHLQHCSVWQSQAAPRSAAIRPTEEVAEGAWLGQGPKPWAFSGIDLVEIGSWDHETWVDDLV